jgi:hypothetical protein
VASKTGKYWRECLQALHDKGMNNHTMDFDFFEQCIYAKHNWVRLSYGATRAKGILELVHNDLFVPVHVPSLGKSM